VLRKNKPHKDSLKTSIKLMNFDQIIPIIYMIGVFILVLPSFLQSNSKLKELLANLSIWVIIVLIVTTIAYFLLK
tara:strand:- start:362 stop:586 length:225 start_codon:yes stop_codon:yes gene_type:complete